jgi:hypothetical protein
MNIVVGDHVRFKRMKFAGGGFFRGRHTGRAHVIGEETIEGVVEKESYGETTGQHTFTVRTADGKAVLVKGRNLYKNIIDHIAGENHLGESDAKAARVELAKKTGGSLSNLPARMRGFA